MNLPRVKAIAVIALCLAGSLLFGEAAYTLHVLRPKLKETLSTTNDTAADVRDYVRFQTDDLKSERTQKMIWHSLQIGAAGLLTIQKFNRTTIPSINRATDEMTERLKDFGLFESQATRTMGKVGDLVTHTDTSLNGELLPAITQLVEKLGVTLDEVNAALKVAADGLGVTTEELKRRLADKRVDSLMDEALGILQEGHGTMAQIHEASKQAPKLAADLEKIAHESSKFARITLIANILGTLGRAFLP